MRNWIMLMAVMVTAASFCTVEAQQPPPGFYKFDGKAGRDVFFGGMAYGQTDNSARAIVPLSPIFYGGKWKERAAVGVISHDPSSSASVIYAGLVDGKDNAPHGFTHATDPDTVFSSFVNDARNLRLQVWSDIVVATWEQQEGSRWVVYAARIDTKEATPVWKNLSGTPLNPAFPTKMTDTYSPDVFGHDVKLIPGTANPGVVWIFQYLNPTGPRELHYIYWDGAKLSTLGTGSTSRVNSFSVQSLTGVALTYDPTPQEGDYEPHLFVGIEQTTGVYTEVRHRYYSVANTEWLWAVNIPAGSMGPLEADWTQNSHQLTGQSTHPSFGRYVWAANGSITAPSAVTLDWGNAYWPSLAQTVNGKIELMYFDENNSPSYNSEVRCAEKVPLGTFKGINGAASYSRVSVDNRTNTNPSVAINSVRKPMGVWTVVVSSTQSYVVGAMYQY